MPPPRFRTLCIAVLSLLLAGSLRADDDKGETLVQAEFDGVQDSQGFYWQIDQRGTVRDSNGWLRDGLLLTVNGTAFNCGQPMQTADTREYVLAQAIAGINVTRRILVNPSRCATRYLEIFENRGGRPAKISVVLGTRFYNRGYTVFGSDGAALTGGLGRNQCGVLFHSGNQGMPSLLFLLTDDRSREKPVVTVQNGMVLSATFNLTVKEHSKVAIVHWLAQRNALSPQGAPALVEEFFKRHRLVAPDLPAGLDAVVVNFSVGASGGVRAPASCLQSALEIIEALGVERGPADVLFPDEEAQLLGRASGGPLDLETAWGKVTVALPEIALVLGDGAGGPLRVFLRDGEILRGRFAAGGLTFTSGSGLEVRLAPERIRTLVLHVDSADGRPPEGAAGFVETHAGDRLALAAGAAPALDLVCAWGSLRVPFDAIDALQYVDAPQSGHRLLLADRSRLFVLLTGADLALATRRQGEVRLHTLDIAAIERLHEATSAPPIDEDRDVRTAWCKLAGDDVLAGAIDLAEIHVVTDVGETAVDPRRVLTLENAEQEGARDTFRLELASGDALVGWLRETVLPIRFGERVLRVPARHVRRVRVPATASEPRTGEAGAAANEAAAVAALRTLYTAEQFWLHNDPDDDLLEDYWTADVFGLYACATAEGRATAAIPAALAHADRFPSAAPGKAFPRPFYVESPAEKPTPYEGYLFEALAMDGEGKPYAQDADGGGKACEHPRKFGFRAVPAAFGKTGTHTFEIDERGRIYMRDLGAAADGVRGDWQGAADPTQATPPWEAVK